MEISGDDSVAWNGNAPANHKDRDCAREIIIDRGRYRPEIPSRINLTSCLSPLYVQTMNTHDGINYETTVGIREADFCFFLSL